MTSSHGNLISPEPTRLPERPEPQAAIDGGADPAEVARAHPDFCEAWARLAEQALAADHVINAYAFARTGYHRGLDQLRRAGWKGHGPVPWAHRPNQGFLRALAALSRAAARIGEEDEHARCRQFLADCDPEAPTATAVG
ncbi:DUF3151 domain-containing protein [Gandjariella thermophila]|uniref:DUF3151 domain-containing protein n=1 Tax=Gandjariella thermophila TaxID=1931992 RepID=A0A4D4JBR6_9PSEU|nr:DUF3151 domain-containing protein [Gandjariella thermophila]GDY32108.1 hypothetical protein GTS_37410 [Gandjariella thermophila]